MKKLNMAMVLVAAAIAMLGFAQAATAVGKIDIMTMNQYLGADLDPIVEAEDPIEFNEAVVAVLEEVAANDFPSRAVALAEIITDRLPDLVGLQEAFIFTCTDLEFPTTQDEGCDNPRIRNAFNEVMIRELRDAFAGIDDDENLRCVILTGEGKAFCAGADLHWMGRVVNYTHDENYEDSLNLAKLMRAIYECPKPVLGRINGAAIGGGTGLVAVCDIVVASASGLFRHAAADTHENWERMLPRDDAQGWAPFDVRGVAYDA